MNTKTAVIYPVFNALPYVQKSLPEVIKAAGENVVIVNDSSNEETSKWLEDTIKDTGIYYVKNSKQQLFTRSVNRGLRLAYKNLNPEFMAVVNTDNRLLDGWLDGLVETMMQDPTIGYVGYAESPLGDKHYRNMEGKIKFDISEPPAFVTGHCLLLRTKMLKEIGVYCETDLGGSIYPEYAPYHGQAHIGSDRHICYKANEAGWQTVYSYYPGCYHEAGKSWNHNLGWLNQFKLDLLWEPNDTLSEPKWY